jgi:uncharacterized protein (TIGR02231 family)
MEATKTKMIAILIVSTLFSTLLSATPTGNNEKSSKSKIENVTVFTQGAQVYRSSAVTLNQGITTLVFENLEATINPNSIQASGLGNFVIMDVQQSIKYPEPATPSSTVKNPKNLKQIKLLQDSLVLINFDLDDIHDKQSAFNIEKNTLLNNRIIKGETKKDTLNLVKDALAFLREKLNNINSELLKLKKQEYWLGIKKQRMEEALAALQNYNENTGDVVKDETNYRIIVTVSADVPTNGTINFNYMLTDAGWTSSYDLRAKATGGNIQLTYKAQVYQNTGTDWNDVKLTLSTADPNQNNIKPVLSTWWLNYYNPYAYNYKESAKSKRSEYANAPSAVASGATLELDAKADAIAETSANYTVANENMTTVEYEIKLAYSIPSDGKAHFVSIQTKDIAAEYIHFAAPKLDKDAFLVAKIADWDELNLTAGNANVYFEGTFVGESYIDPNNLTDTMDLTLGRDKNMVVTRVKQKDKTKEKVIGDEKVKTVTYEITVRNTKASASNFNLQDQIPVSQNKEVVVTLVESSGGVLDETSGIVNWKFNIKPKETKKVTITYSVKFPKDKVLAGL